MRRCAYRYDGVEVVFYCYLAPGLQLPEWAGSGRYNKLNGGRS
jgi:hypothetical protein